MPLEVGQRVKIKERVALFGCQRGVITKVNDTSYNVLLDGFELPMAFLHEELESA